MAAFMTTTVKTTSNPTSVLWLPRFSLYIPLVTNSPVPHHQYQSIFAHTDSIITLGFYLPFISINKKLKLDNSIKQQKRNL